MKLSLLITGISGFVGRSLFEKLNFADYEQVFLLIPEEPLPLFVKNLPENVVVIRRDLSDPALAGELPEKFDTLLHMAAITGKDKPSRYDEVNFELFRQLAEAGKGRGLKNVLLISTIAVKFRKRKRYFYSFSKEKAEQYLKKSGLNYSIVRPTMILGNGSPVFKGFSMFAGLPLIPLFGGGKAVVQPVHLEDVCMVILHILEHNIFKGGTYDLGGPDTLSIREFMWKIAEQKGKKARFLPVPMWMALLPVSVMDRLFYFLTPLTLGQMATFRNDSVADENPVTREVNPGFLGIDSMVDDSVKGEMREAEIRTILRECRVFTKYLIGRKPTDYNERKYLEYIKKSDRLYINGFDRLLSSLAVKSPLFTKICDAYSRFFFPNSMLRNRLGTLFAILETSPVTYKHIDIIGNKSLLGIMISLGFRGVWFVFHLFLSIPFFLPLQILTGRKKEEREKGEPNG